MAARLRATDARARPRAIGRRRTRCHDGGRRGRRVRGGWRRLGHRSEQPHSRNRCGARRRRLYRHCDGLGRPPSLGRGRIRRVSRPGAAARSVGGRGTRGRRGRGGCVPARVRARRANRVRRPRGVRSRRTRSDRSRERRSARGRGAPAAGARDSRGSPSAVGRGPGTCPPRADRRGVRKRGRSRSPVPRGPRVVDDATAAPGAREPLRRARRQPGHGSRARARRDRQSSRPDTALT